jgi:hypothetical protein
MPGACGIACEICVLHEKEMCSGCAPGTDPKAQAFIEELKGEGLSCPVIECAVKNKVDYCFRCEGFPCDIHYQAALPYTNALLDTWKKYSGK